MNNNLKLFRTLSGFTPKELAKLLNVTAHTYNAFENDRMTVSKEIEIMLGKIYDVSVDTLWLSQESLPQDTRQKIGEMSELTSDSRWNLAVNRLFGRQIKVTYHRVKLLKDEILNGLSNDNEE